MTDALTRIGEVVSINNSIMLLLIDAADAPRWHGSSNGPVEFEPEGSDWQSAFDAIYPADTQPLTFAAVKGAEVSGWVISLSESGPGRVEVFKRGGRVVLVEGFSEGASQEQARLAFAASLPRKAVEAGRIKVKSGVLACMPTTAPGEPFARGSAGDVDLSDEQGVRVQVANGEYRILLEPVSTGDWGEVTCAVLEPWP